MTLMLGILVCLMLVVASCDDGADAVLVGAEGQTLGEDDENGTSDEDEDADDDEGDEDGDGGSTCEGDIKIDKGVEDGNHVYNAPPGGSIASICIKAGQPTYTFACGETDDTGCYDVTWTGDDCCTSVEIGGGGTSNTCKDISHTSASFGEPCDDCVPEDERCDNGLDDDCDGDIDCDDSDCAEDPACDQCEPTGDERCDSGLDDDCDGDIDCDDSDCAEDPACK
jgi:hypothetical protein